MPSSQNIITAIRSVVGEGSIALHEPTFEGNEWHYLKDCLDSNYVSSVGEYVDRFESSLTAYTGAKYAIAVVNGTAALHVSLKLIGVEANDEVLVPTLSFIATANAVSYCGAVPHFVDSETKSWGIDPEKLRDYLTSATEQRSGLCINKATGRVIRAVIAMHVFGHPCDINQLLAICFDFNLLLVEDAAESIGSFYFGRHTGTLGSVGTLSFNGNKTITTGGGGAILTNNEKLAAEAKHITKTAKVAHSWRYMHDQVGFNYRMPNINAALGCAQMERLPSLLQAKRELTRRYQHAFESLVEIKLQLEPFGCQSNYWLQAIQLISGRQSELTNLLVESNANGLMTRPVWDLLHDQIPYQTAPKMDLANAVKIVSSVLNIPSSANLVSES